MKKPDLTLESVKKSAKVKNHRASDFLTNEQIEEVHKSNRKGKKSTFNSVDSYIAEILARFGYDAYVAWKFGEISEDNMAKFIMAERAREAQNRLNLETILVAAIAGANNRTKQGHLPKSLKAAIKMLKKEEKLAKEGE